METYLTDTGIGEFIVLMGTIGVCYTMEKIKEYRRKKRLEKTPYGRYILSKGGKW